MQAKIIWCSTKERPVHYFGSDAENKNFSSLQNLRRLIEKSLRMILFASISRSCSECAEQKEEADVAEERRASVEVEAMMSEEVAAADAAVPLDALLKVHVPPQAFSFVFQAARLQQVIALERAFVFTFQPADRPV